MGVPKDLKTTFFLNQTNTDMQVLVSSCAAQKPGCLDGGQAIFRDAGGPMYRGLNYKYKNTTLHNKGWLRKGITIRIHYL